MWSFPGTYANRGSGTEQASSDVEQGTGVDLRCGGGHLGLQRAPGALPRALGFDSHLDAKDKSRPDGRLLSLEQGTGVEPA